MYYYYYVCMKRQNGHKIRFRKIIQYRTANDYDPESKPVHEVKI